MRSLFYAYQRLQEVRRRNQALQDRVHEAGVVLAVLQAQVRVILLVGLLGEQR